MGLVNLNDQYKINSSKSKRGNQAMGTVMNVNIKATGSKNRSNSQGSNDK